jgi:hypothetical protein
MCAALLIPAGGAESLGPGLRAEVVANDRERGLDGRERLSPTGVRELYVAVVAVEDAHGAVEGVPEQRGHPAAGDRGARRRGGRRALGRRGGDIDEEGRGRRRCLAGGVDPGTATEPVGPAGTTALIRS